MPTPLTRDLAATMTASAVAAEVLERTLPVSGITIRARALSHLDAAKITAGALAKAPNVTDITNRRQRRAAGNRATVAELEAAGDDGLADGFLDALCRALARAVVDVDDELIFDGHEAVAGWLNALAPEDFAEVLELGSALVSASRLDRAAGDDEEPLAVGKGSSRSARTSSRSTTRASSSAASRPSSARSRPLRST